MVPVGMCCTYEWMPKVIYGSEVYYNVAKAIEFGDRLGSNPGSTTYWLCDSGQVT